MPTQEKPSQTVTLHAEAALVGPELDQHGPVTITIEDGVITRIEPAEVGTEGAVDLPGLMLVPGFIDAHVHIEFFEPSSLLAGGITTARDLGWPPERIFPLVERSAETGFDGPEVVAAGPMITAEGGYPTRAGWAPPGTGLEVRSPKEARAAVDQVAELKPSVIKVALNPPVGPTLDLETLTAIVEQAHSHGLKVTGHVYGVDELEKALDAGLDELGHMLMSTERIPEPLIGRMVKQGMRVVPTLSIRFMRDQRVAIENLQRFIAAGGEVIYGTDLGNGGPEPGIDLREVTAMEKAGMSSLDIIRSATVDSAAWLSLEDRGVLQVGARADLVGLSIGALEDAAALSEVRFVVRAGIVKEL
jgi:imidazolonepropionase-like amidohydrolase